jgi:hypothetical protein
MAAEPQQAREGRTVQVQVPATSANLGPGFDTLGLALSVYDELTITALSDDRLEIEVTGSGSSEIARDESNLIVRSIEHVYKDAGRRMPGLRTTESRMAEDSARPVPLLPRVFLQPRAYSRETSSSRMLTCSASPRSSRGIPTTSHQRSSAALRSRGPARTVRSTRSFSCTAVSPLWCSFLSG